MHPEPSIFVYHKHHSNLVHCSETPCLYGSGRLYAGILYLGPGVVEFRKLLSATVGATLLPPPERRVTIAMSVFRTGFKHHETRLFLACRLVSSASVHMEMSREAFSSQAFHCRTPEGRTHPVRWTSPGPSPRAITCSSASNHSRRETASCG